MHRFSPAIAILILSFFLAACGSPQTPVGYKEITFENQSPLRLDVGEILVEQAYQPPGELPHVDHAFPVRPVDAALRWGGDRLRVAGRANTAHYVVQEASAVEVPLKKSGGLDGLFKIDQSARYDLKIAVEVKIIGPSGVPARAKAEATRSITVPENITDQERKAVWHRLTEKTMRDLDGELEKAIRRYLVAYVIP